jgi:hypothetical protein
MLLFPLFAFALRRRAAADAARVSAAPQLYDFSREAGGIVAGNHKLFAEIVWPPGRTVGVEDVRDL